MSFAMSICDKNISTKMRHYDMWDDGKPETELNFKLYRQATNKIISLSKSTVAFLDGYFERR